MKELENMNLITVFTPTYNRAYCLNKRYESMQKQSCKAFDWLIVDDGSTDNTKELVEKWIKQKTEFNIRYIYKENGGMHTAYNTAYANIDTELSVNVDSDDYLTDTAIEDILSFWKKNKRENIGAIYALDQYEDGNVVGTPFPNDLKEFKGWGYKNIVYYSGGKKKVFRNSGDKKLIGVTAVINKYPPIPVFEGEKYHSLYYKQHLLERDYTVLIMNKPVCVVEYMNDGSSKNMFYQYVRNPKGFCNERRYVMKYAPSFKLKIEACIHYVAESLLAKDYYFIGHSTNRLFTLISVVPGVLLYFIIKRKTKK